MWHPLCAAHDQYDHADTVGPTYIEWYAHQWYADRDRKVVLCDLGWIILSSETAGTTSGGFFSWKQ